MGAFEDKFLKKRFSKPGDLGALADRSSIVLSLFKKVQQGGASVAEPAIFDGPEGFSYSLPAAQAVAAQADRGASDYGEWNSTFGQYFGSAVISARAVAGGKNEPDAYLRQLTEVMLSSMKKFGALAARKLVGPVGGSVARIAAVNGGGTNGELTLTLRGDCFNIQAGQILQAADSTGNGVPANVRAGLGYVISVFPDGDTDTTQVRVATSEANRVAGTVGLPSGWANSDFLFRNGDIAASTDLSDKQIRSLQAWVTLAAATDTYNGVPRLQDARLSGNRISSTDISGLSVLDRCMLLVNECFTASGARPDYLAVGPRTWQQAADEARSFGTYTFGKSTVLGVTTLKLMTVAGEVELVADPHVLEADIWALTSEDMVIYHYDGFPALVNADGVEILRQATAAAFEVRYQAFNCMTLKGKPWHFGRCSSGN